MTEPTIGTVTMGDTEAADMVERIAIDMHYADGDPCTVKWAKQPGKYRASMRKGVRNALASMKRLGLYRPSAAPQPAHGTSATGLEKVRREAYEAGWEMSKKLANPPPVTGVEGQLRNYCRILLANLDYLSEVTGESVGEEDAIIVNEIRAALHPTATGSDAQMICPLSDIPAQAGEVAGGIIDEPWVRQSERDKQDAIKAKGSTDAK